MKSPVSDHAKKHVATRKRQSYYFHTATFARLASRPIERYRMRKAGRRTVMVLVLLLLLFIGMYGLLF